VHQRASEEQRARWWLTRRWWYSEEIDVRFGDAVKFAETYSVPVRIHLTRVRGF
jgi:hypothetical protein